MGLAVHTMHVKSAHNRQMKESFAAFTAQLSTLRSQMARQVAKAKGSGGGGGGGADE